MYKVGDCNRKSVTAKLDQAIIKNTVRKLLDQKIIKAMTSDMVVKTDLNIFCLPKSYNYISMQTNGNLSLAISISKQVNIFLISSLNVLLLLWINNKVWKKQRVNDSVICEILDVIGSLFERNEIQKV